MHLKLGTDALQRVEKEMYAQNTTLILADTDPIFQDDMPNIVILASLVMIGE